MPGIRRHGALKAKVQHGGQYRRRQAEARHSLGRDAREARRAGGDRIDRPDHRAARSGDEAGQRLRREGRAGADEQGATAEEEEEFALPTSAA